MRSHRRQYGWAVVYLSSTRVCWARTLCLPAWAAKRLGTRISMAQTGGNLRKFRTSVMSNSPSAYVDYKGGLYVFHQGLSTNFFGVPYEDGTLWYSYFDGTNWHPDTQVPTVGISESPSAVVYPPQ